MGQFSELRSLRELKKTVIVRAATNRVLVEIFQPAGAAVLPNRSEVRSDERSEDKAKLILPGAKTINVGSRRP